MVGVVWASRIALVLWSLYLKHAYFIIGFFFQYAKVCLFAPRVEFAGLDHDCFECQRCRGYSHSSHLLQVNSSEENTGRKQ